MLQNQCGIQENVKTRSHCCIFKMAYLFVNKQELYFRTYHHFGFSNKSYQIRGDVRCGQLPVTHLVLIHIYLIMIEIIFLCKNQLCTQTGLLEMRLSGRLGKSNFKSLFPISSYIYIYFKHNTGTYLFQDIYASGQQEYVQYYGRQQQERNFLFEK